MGESKSSANGAGEGDILALLDARMRQIAEETFRQMTASSDVGAVKVKTAAPMLDMTEGRVRSLINEGKLLVIHPTPKTIRIPLSEIKRYLEGQKK